METSKFLPAELKGEIEGAVYRMLRLSDGEYARQFVRNVMVIGVKGKKGVRLPFQPAIH